MADQEKAVRRKTLRIRASVKKSKPSFLRPESWRYTRLKESWRRPRGLDHKMRRKFKGWPATVNVGYRGPKAARELHPSGWREVLVYNTDELGQIDPKTQAIRIAHAVGKRKRIKIIAEARKRKMRILNLKQAKEPAEEEKGETVEEKEQEAKPEETQKIEETPKKEEPEASKETQKRKARSKKQ